VSPLELVLFLEELKEWDTPNTELRDEAAQLSRAPRQLLDIVEALERIHLGDS
jgi:hypothetical protein